VIPKGKNALTAQLSSVEVLFDRSIKTVTVRADLDNPGWLMPGQTVTLEFPPDPPR
jgi:multidrug efflux pump subunit AcrA (membrane-fusion protein)